MFHQALATDTWLVMDVDLCIDLIFFFPPSPLLVAAAKAAATDENSHNQEEVVIRGMVMVIILFSHHSNRQILWITPVILLTHIYLSSLSICYQQEIKVDKTLKGSLKEKIADMQEYFIYSYKKLFTIYNLTIISYVLSGCVV